MPTLISCSASRERQRLEQDRIDHAEDGGVRADPERERQDRDEGEDWDS